MAELHIIVGLGNPGEEYAETRHNAGFRVVDELAQQLSARYWKRECGAFTAQVSYQGHDIVLAKPQSFMNLSGGPVKKLLEAYDASVDNLIVVHDELDIPAGTVRVKSGGGHGGHNGLRSICEKLQTPKWLRVRCGIGRPPGRMDAADFVLSVPKKDDADNFEHVVQLGADAVLSLIANGLDKTQQQFNTKAAE